jgi:glycosyltransferase involved in cell wall biosynthesis
LEALRIAYITETSVYDKHAWSGTAHYVYHALLKQGFVVEALGPARPRALRFFLAALNKLSILVFNRRIDYRHSTLYSLAFGKIFSKRIRNVKHDLVVVCGGTECGAYIETSKPVFYVLDRTIAGAINYHQILKDLWRFSEKQSIGTDKRAMLSARRVFFSSEWAAEHARRFYNLPQRKISVVPFGANMDHLPSREEALAQKSSTECRMLLVGTYWHNKGADIAYNAMKELVKRNVNAHLTVAGCLPPEPINDPRLKIVPFIDKNSPEGIRELHKLFKDHHFFILPTRFDCTPIVFCEAGAFGLPVLSANTGGVEGHVKDGTNGFLIPFEDPGDGYAQKIEEIFADQIKYRELCRTSRDYYETHLNWRSWAMTFSRQVELDLF